jgi:hypothetical protein
VLFENVAEIRYFGRTVWNNEIYAKVKRRFVFRFVIDRQDWYIQKCMNNVHWISHDTTLQKTEVGDSTVIILQTVIQYDFQNTSQCQHVYNFYTQNCGIYDNVCSWSCGWMEISRTINLQLLHVGFWFGLFFVSDDGGDMFLRNVSCLCTDWTAIFSRRCNFSLQK